MDEKQDGSGQSFWLDHFDNFRDIARDLREFEAYEIISDLEHRLRYCRHPTESAETLEDVYRKGIRITVVGEASASEKRKFIEDAFPQAVPLQVENFLGVASGIEYYAYREKADGIRFVFLNTPSFSNWRDVNQIMGMGEWHTEAVVFLISGNKINQAEKRCLNEIKYLVDSEFLFLVQGAKGQGDKEDTLDNLNTIADILAVKKKLDIPYLSSPKSREIARYFAVDTSEKWRGLLLRKIRNYMLQYYRQFETRVEGYLESLTTLDRFQRDLQEIENQTTKAVDRINKRFIDEIVRDFPIEANYSSDIRAEMKRIAQLLSEGKIKTESDVSRLLESNTKELLEDWTRYLEDIIAKYLRDISRELSERISEFGGISYRSPIPLNRKIELQVMSDFSLYLFRTNAISQYLRILPSGILPGYFIGAAIAGLASNPVGWAIVAGITIAAVIIAVNTWASSEDRKKQQQNEMLAESEKNMRPFNYYIAQTIRMDCEEIIHFSQDALQDIFKEIRKAERKRVTLNNFYPTIKAITEDSLLEKISENRTSIASVSMQAIPSVHP